MGVGLDFRQGGFDLVEVALVAVGPASFVGGELGEVRISGADRGEPSVDADRFGQLADVFVAEVLRRSCAEDAIGIDGLGAASVDKGCRGRP